MDSIYTTSNTNVWIINPTLSVSESWSSLVLNTIMVREEELLRLMPKLLIVIAQELFLVVDPSILILILLLIQLLLMAVF